jgi:Fe-S-cluster containining protein
MTPIDKTDLAAAVANASERVEVRQAVGRVYQLIERATARRKPLCVLSGRCCHFEEYGHRLYVTTLELATFAHHLGSFSRAKDWDGSGCPFQVGKRCGVHPIRPMGCRMFFCDPSSTGWQNRHYEAFHARLKRLHEALDVPYAYLEWREALTLLER